jgi:hypothetical protein
MADDKPKRDQQSGGDQSQDRQRNRNRKPSAGSMESPQSTPTRREDEQESEK